MKENNKPITVEIARKMLGKRGEVMTEKEIRDILIFLRSMCNKTIDCIIERN